MLPASYRVTGVEMPERVVLLSGGSRGLGAGILEHLLAAGHSVATFSRRATKLTDRLGNNPTLSDRFTYSNVDASDADALRGFVTHAQERFGRIDVLINNAGVAYDELLAMTPEEHIDRMLSVNLRATLLLAKECVRLMLRQRSGSIINVSSIVGVRGFSGLAAYSSTKAGIDGMTRSLAKEVGKRNIRVNAVAPGYLDTDMSEALTARQRMRMVRRTPLGRLGLVSDIVPVIDFLMSDTSAFVTGQVIHVDGGITL